MSKISDYVKNTPVLKIDKDGGYKTKALFIVGAILIIAFMVGIGF